MKCLQYVRCNVCNVSRKFSIKIIKALEMCSGTLTSQVWSKRYIRGFGARPTIYYTSARVFVHPTDQHAPVIIFRNRTSDLWLCIQVRYLLLWVCIDHGGTIPAVKSSLPLFGINFAFIENTTLKHFHITFESRTLKLNGALRLNVVKFVYWVVCYSTDTGGNIKVVLLPPWLIVAKHRITNLLATHRHVTLSCVTRCDQQCWKI